MNQEVEDKILSVLQEVPQALQQDALVRCICRLYKQTIDGTPMINQIYQVGKLEVQMINQMHIFFAPVFNPTPNIPVEQTKHVNKKDLH
jgi:hypothetical protein